LTQSNQLANRRMIITKFEALSIPSGICPKRFLDLCGDAFRSSDFFCSGTSQYNSADAIDRGRRKPHLPIVSAMALLGDLLLNSIFWARLHGGVTHFPIAFIFGVNDETTYDSGKLVTRWTRS